MTHPDKALFVNGGPVQSDGEKSLSVSPKGAAAAVPCCLNLIYDAIRRSELKARKMGRRTIILRADLEHWLDSLPVLDLNNNPSTPTARNRNPVGRRKRVGEGVAA
jgi:hypothetical protein